LVLLKLFINITIKQHTSTGSLGFIEAVHQQQYKAAYQRGKALVLLKLFINSNIKQRTSVGSLGFIEAVHQQQYKAAYQHGKPWFY